MKKILFICFVTLSVGFLILFIKEWKLITAESQISFSIKNLGRTVKGSLKGMEADITFIEDDLLNSHVKGSIDVKTINTGNKKRDKHLRSSDFFDAEKYPYITFKSDKISKSENGFIAHGILTIKDVSKETDLLFNFENKGSSGIFKGKLSIDRTAFHVGKKSKIMGEIVEVEIIAAVER